jgi:hypothetical protein
MNKINLKNRILILSKLLLFIILIVNLNGCIPDESPVKPHEKGDVITGSVELGTLYQNQVYFNLATEKIVASNKSIDWDIAFCCYADSFPVILNTSKGMRVLNTGKLKLSEVSLTDTIGVEDSLWTYDNPAGKLDSTAIGSWWETIKVDNVSSKSEVYIVDRGVNERSKAIGLRKMQILGFDENTYHIKFANMDGSGESLLDIKKNPMKNFIQVSLNGSGAVVDFEPFSSDWDFCFTKYTEKLYLDSGAYQWYGVTGPLLNPRRSSAVHYPDSVFENVQYENVKDLPFSYRVNSIGHDWKWFDFANGFYLILPKKIYIIQTPLGFYKLHFVDFYNPSGEKGYPKFEYQKL